MTTIIRSNVTLSNPRPSAMLLPPLGVSGVTHRWHAEAVAGKPGQAVTVVPDTIGNAELSTVAGAVTLGETSSGRRYLDLSGETPTLNRIYGAAQGDSKEAFTLAGLVYWETGGTNTASFGLLNTATSASSQAVSLDPRGGRVQAYAGGTILSTAASDKTGWHTVIVSYQAAGEEALSLDGGTVVRGEAHDKQAAPPITSFGMSGRTENKVRVMDYVFINRALTDAEHAKVHAALAAQIPA